MRTNGITIELPVKASGRVRIGVRPEDIVLSAEPLLSSASKLAKGSGLASRRVQSMCSEFMVYYPNFTFA